MYCNYPHLYAAFQHVIGTVNKTFIITQLLHNPVSIMKMEMRTKERKKKKNNSGTAATKLC